MIIEKAPRFFRSEVRKLCVADEVFREDVKGALKDLITLRLCFFGKGELEIAATDFR